MSKFCQFLKGERRNRRRGLAYLPGRCSKSLFLLTLFGVGACSWPELPSLPSLPELPSFSLATEGTDNRPSESCDAEILENARGLDWQEAKTFDVHIRKDRLVPSTLVMKAEKPNIVRIFNRDRKVQTFRAEEFFKHAVVAGIYYDGHQVAESCITAIRIGPRKWAELLIVPLRQGEFPIGEDSPAAYSTEPPRKTGKIIVR